jgi:hypothetical protein
MNLEQIAQLAHNVNYVYCLQIEDITAKTWDEAPDWQKDSARAGVEMVLKSLKQGVAVSPWQTHIEWMKHKTAEGWVYGEKKDATAKTHPCMLPWNELPEQQRLKDQLFIGVVEACARHYEP